MSEFLIKPGATLGNYPQRPETGLDDLETVIRRWGERVGQPLVRQHLGTGRYGGQGQVPGTRPGKLQRSGV